MPRFRLKHDCRPCRLVLGETGPHRFGGVATHNGASPTSSQVALHHVLSFETSDSNCPVTTDGSIRRLPLYYPLKYGAGGAAIQYSVLSDTEIQILYLSPEEADDEDNQYVQVPFLPEARATLIPLEYEEARIIGFMAAEHYFSPNAEDWAIIQRLDFETHQRKREIIGSYDNIVGVGGLQIRVRDAEDFICRNGQCKLFGRRIGLDVIASIPPIPVSGSDEFWYEFRGADMRFFFGLCPHCGTVIASNQAS